MTTDTITQNPSPTHDPSPNSTTGSSNRRFRRGALGAALALATLGGAVAVAGLSGSDGAVAPTSGAVAAPEAAVHAMSADAAERWAIAEAEAHERLAVAGSADAVDRRAQLALSAHVASCRSGAAAPDALERCLAARGG